MKEGYTCLDNISNTNGWGCDVIGMRGKSIAFDQKRNIVMHAGLIGNIGLVEPCLNVFVASERSINIFLMHRIREKWNSSMRL